MNDLSKRHFRVQSTAVIYYTIFIECIIFDVQVESDRILKISLDSLRGHAFNCVWLIQNYVKFQLFS